VIESGFPIPTGNEWFARVAAAGVNVAAGRGQFPTDTRRRSATGAGVAAGTAAGRTPWVSGTAHSSQKRSSGSLDAPHKGHATASGLAHCAPNLRPALFVAPQVEQIIPASDASCSVPEG
jgi:hypothetical protein